MVTLLLYGGHSWLDRLIAYFSRGPFTHAAIAIDDVVFEELAQGLVCHRDAAAANVRAAAIASKVIPVDGVGKAAMLGFYNRLLDEHAGYAYAQLVVDALQRVDVTVSIEDGDRYLCSGAVGAGLALAGYRFNKDPRALTPNDLATYFAPLPAGAPVLP